jgi:hypothetical protein
MSITNDPIPKGIKNRHTHVLLGFLLIGYRVSSTHCQPYSKTWELLRMTKKETFSGKLDTCFLCDLLQGSIGIC